MSNESRVRAEPNQPLSCVLLQLAQNRYGTRRSRARLETFVPIPARCDHCTRSCKHLHNEAITSYTRCEATTHAEPQTLGLPPSNSIARGVH